MSARRVALVTYAFKVGGMESMLLALGQGLVRRGWAVDVVTTIERGEWFPCIAAAGLGAVHVEGRDRALDLGPEAHVERVGAVLGARGYRAVMLHHAKYAQAFLPKLGTDVFAMPVLHNDDEAIYRVGLACPDAWNVAVAVSPKVAEQARRRVGGGRVELVANGVAVPPQGGARTRAAGPLRVLSVGRLVDAQKGTSLLPAIVAEAVRRQVELRLDVIGDGPDRAAL